MRKFPILTPELRSHWTVCLAVRRRQLTHTRQPVEWSGTLRLFLLTGLQLEARPGRTLICSARGSWWKAEEPCFIDPIDWSLTFKRKAFPPPLLSPFSVPARRPPHTGKPPLNNIIVHFILTVSSARRGGRGQGLIESLKRAVPPLKADWACECVWLLLIAMFLNVCTFFCGRITAG